VDRSSPPRRSTISASPGSYARPEWARTADRAASGGAMRAITSTSRASVTTRAEGSIASPARPEGNPPPSQRSNAWSIARRSPAPRPSRSATRRATPGAAGGSAPRAGVADEPGDQLGRPSRVDGGEGGVGGQLVAEEVAGRGRVRRAPRVADQRQVVDAVGVRPVEAGLGRQAHGQQAGPRPLLERLAHADVRRQ